LHLIFGGRLILLFLSMTRERKADSQNGHQLQVKGRKKTIRQNKNF